MQATRRLPFGGYRAGSGGPNEITDHAYTSQRENMEIGLYYYNARYYAPTLARFLSPDTIVPDPANPQAFNHYSYVENNPINFSDPTGHCKNGRGKGPGTCQVDGEPDISIGTWRWYDEVAPKNGVQMHKMTDDEFAAFADQYVDGYLERYGNDFYLPDVVGINASVSGSAGAHANMGLEWVFNLESHQFTTFVVAGGGGSAGASGQVSLSGVAIYNLGEDNYDYRGSFVDVNGTVSLGPGFIAGHAWVPRERMDGPRSYYAGAALGAGASLNVSRVEYIPIHTVDLDDLTISYLLTPYSQEFVFDRLIPFIENILP